MTAKREINQNQATLPTVVNAYGEEQSIAENVSDLLCEHDTAGAILDMLTDYVYPVSDLMNRDSLTLGRDEIVKLIVLQHELMKQSDRTYDAWVWDEYQALVKSL